MAMFVGRSKEFSDKVHATWRELIQIDPITAEDESQRLGFLLWFEYDLFEQETEQSRDSLNNVINYLENRAEMLLKLSDQRRFEMMTAYCQARANRMTRSSWQRAEPRCISQEEYELLMIAQYC